MAARMVGACSGAGQKCSRLTVDEILTRLDDSDIDLSDSDDGDSPDESCMFAPNNDDDPNTPSSDDSDSDEGDNDAPCPSTSSGQSVDKKAQQKTKTPALNWHSVNRHQFNPGSTSWLQINGPKDQPESPAGYFFKYFPPSIFLTFAEQTNMYYFRTKGRNLGTKPEEIRKFFGVSIIMANLGFPRIRMYWQHATKVDRVANALPVNRYFQLRTNLHINAAQEAQNGETNKFWKVQPLVDVVRARCRELPREEFSSVDEQMIHFTGRVPAKQFIKSKPNPVGVKNFVICGKSGRALDFELYQGKGTGIPEETKHLGLGASIVLRLTETIPKEKNYKVCFDNYFTGIPLIRELKQNGIHSLGVIKSNRLMGCTLKSEKELKKEGRGSLDCKVSGKGDICAVRWFDNGIVTLASSFVGVGEMDQVRRWSESSKVHILVDRPQCVQIYNDYMGGVDKLDFLISLYRIKSRTRKWPVRVVFHFIDLALVNSWLEYRDHERAHGIPRARILDLLAFRNEVAEVLLRANPPAPPVVGRPRLSCSPPKDAPDAKRSRPAERPAEDIRYDGVNHLPDSVKHLGQRCKLEGCKGRSRVKCVKCEVFLCLNSTKNCFMIFHTK